MPTFYWEEKDNGFGRSAGRCAAWVEDKQDLRKVVTASFIGTTIEWYDFFLYGTAAALVFDKLFFPNVEPLDRHAARRSAPTRSASPRARSAASCSATSATASAASRCSCCRC